MDFITLPTFIVISMYAFIIMVLIVSVIIYLDRKFWKKNILRKQIHIKFPSLTDCLTELGYKENLYSSNEKGYEVGVASAMYRLIEKKFKLTANIN